MVGTTSDWDNERKKSERGEEEHVGCVHHVGAGILLVIVDEGQNEMSSSSVSSKK